MIKEEQTIERQFGKKAPFTVPEGYFDHLTENIMAQIPEQKPIVIPMRPTLWKRLRPLAAAACFGAILFGVGIYFDKDTATPQSDLASTKHVSSSTQDYNAIDAAADYTMMDNEAVYAYVAGY